MADGGVGLLDNIGVEVVVEALNSPGGVLREAVHAGNS